jgi:large subunit ribosomal protein L1
MANKDKNAFDKEQTYSIEDALEYAKNNSKAKFDESIEVHIRLGIDPRKGDQQVRSAVSLPHGTGKTIKVAAFVTDEKKKAVEDAGADFIGNEELIAKIKKTEKTDFQVAVAEPTLMKSLAPIAKILGTRGLMPSPKNETVTPDPAKAVKELKKGKISFKNDDTGNIHVAIGKASFDNNKLLENFNTLIEALRKAKPSSSKGIFLQNVSISSTMGPGIKVQI